MLAFAEGDGDSYTNPCVSKCVDSVLSLLTSSLMSAGAMLQSQWDVVLGSWSKASRPPASETQ